MSSPAGTESRSLQRRLDLGMGAGLAALLLLGSALTIFATWHLGQRYVAGRLGHDLDTLLAASAVTGGTLGVDSQRLTLIYQQPYSGHYYRVSWEDQTVRSRSLWDADFKIPPLSAGQRWSGSRSGPQGQHLLVLAQGVHSAGRVRTVAVAEDVAPLRAALLRLSAGIAGFALASLALLLWLQRRLVRTGLRPLLRLTADLERVERGERESLPLAGVPTEVLPLVARFNDLLALLSARLQRSRKGLGNLAHALKTPLAVLTQTADELRGSPAGERLTTQLALMGRTIERELRRARLAGGAVGLRPFDLTEALDALLDTLGRIYRDRELDLSLECDPRARFAGDREDFLELMGVLLDNACKWAHRRVRVSAYAGERLRVIIEDDGPGISPAERDRLLARGARRDEAQPGAGLGLAIAGDVVEQYQGSLGLSESRWGGLAVELELPQGRG